VFTVGMCGWIKTNWCDCSDNAAHLNKEVMSQDATLKRKECSSIPVFLIMLSTLVRYRIRNVSPYSGSSLVCVMEGFVLLF